MKNKIKITKKSGNIVGVKCYAHWQGIDGQGTCNTKCQWWKGVGCIMWNRKVKKVREEFLKKI